MMPTLAQLAGAKPTKNDGISIVSTLLGKEHQQKKHKYLFWGGTTTSAVRMGKWKAVKPPKKKNWELYDLSKDIGEQNNIASEHPEIIDIIEHIPRALEDAMNNKGKKWGRISAG